MAIDWSTIKTEYVTTNTTYRKLASKYGIKTQNIARKGKSDGWVEARKRFDAKKMSEIEKSVAKTEAERASKVISATDQLTDRLVSALLEMDMTNVAALRQIASALKDVREIYGLNRSKLDDEEQHARIEALKTKYSIADDDKSSQGIVLLPVINGDLVPPKDTEDA